MKSPILQNSQENKANSKYDTHRIILWESRNLETDAIIATEYAYNCFTPVAINSSIDACAVYFHALWTDVRDWNNHCIKLSKSGSKNFRYSYAQKTFVKRPLKESVFPRSILVIL